MHKCTERRHCLCVLCRHKSSGERRRLEITTLTLSRTSFECYRKKNTHGCCWWVCVKCRLSLIASECKVFKRDSHTVCERVGKFARSWARKTWKTSSFTVKDRVFLLQKNISLALKCFNMLPMYTLLWQIEIEAIFALSDWDVAWVFQFCWASFLPSLILRKRRNT